MFYSRSRYQRHTFVDGCIPSKGQRAIYVDGAFDWFTAGHVSFLEAVRSVEKFQHSGLDPFLTVGVYADMNLSRYKGVIWPVMNMVGRAPTLLQCRVSLYSCIACTFTLLY